MTEMIRITTYPGKRTVYRSSITGKFVSKNHYLDNPDTTYKSTVRTPKYEWVDVHEFKKHQATTTLDPINNR